MPAFEYISPTTLDARLQELAKRLVRGVNLDVDLERRLMGLMENPHKAYPVIHVAGTNGKGSVCAFLSSIYRQAGYRVGLYTSPHLVRFNERIQVNGVPVTNDELVSVMNHMNDLIGDEVASLGRLATFFEFVTAVAFELFRRRQVDVVILETGLGGRLDATNVVDPLVAVITSISMDHADFLGSTLVEIAGEKAGIIKPGRPVVVSRQIPSVLDCISTVAHSRQSPFFYAALDVESQVVDASLDGTIVQFRTVQHLYDGIRLPILGAYQVDNAAVAIRAAEIASASGVVPISREHIRMGLETMAWPGRMQILSKNPLMVLDCAHNPDAGIRLAAALEEYGGGRPVGLIVGMCKDKDAKSFLNALSKVAKTCWPVVLRTDRALSSADMADAVSGYPWSVRTLTLKEAMVDARNWAVAENGLLCIAGSIYLAGEVLELLEREPLNE